MAEDSASSATDAAAALDSFYDYSIVQPHDHEYAGEADTRLTGSSGDLHTLQNVSASTTTTRGNEGSTGKGRLDSLKENMYKQQERLTALKERARRSQDGRRQSSMSDSVESLKTLGQRLTVLQTRPGDASTPLATPTKDTTSPDVSLVQTSGNEKLLMLTQRTEQNRALLEQRKRDLAKSLLSMKTLGLGQRTAMGTGPELGSGSSMTDLRQVAAAATSAANPPVSRHRSALNLEAQEQELALDENRVKMLKSRMKLTELRQSRQEQELLEQRTELARRAHLIEQLELSGAELQRTLTQRSEELEQLRLSQRESQPAEYIQRESLPVEHGLQEQENSRLQGEVLGLRERLAELENINDMLETSRCELQDELSTARERERERERELAASNTQTEEEAEAVEASTSSTEVLVNVELAKQLQELSHQNAEMLAINEELRRTAAAQKLHVTDASVSEHLEALEATIAYQSSQLDEQKNAMAVQTEELAEKTTELNVLNVNLRLLEEKLTQSSRSKPLFLADPLEDGPDGDKRLQEELRQLKQKLDDSNKANIKLKLKGKQAEKQLQRLQAQDGQQRLATLTAENEELQQRITVLEDEKGQWQLASMERSQQEDTPSPSQLEAIRLLEEQKLELQQALEALQQGHESARVESELSEAQMEEQLTQRVRQLEHEAQEQRQQLDTLQAEKETLDKKLSHYISENMELLDKLEKLSSSSSAESIEIVERQQLECYAQRRPASEGDAQEQKQQKQQDPPGPSHVSELTQTDQDESLAQLRERLELFTQERGEVLDKLEQLAAENAQLQLRLEESSTSLQLLQRERERERERDLLSSTSTSSNLSQELSSMQRSSEVVATLDAGEGGPALFDKCEKSLGKLSAELEAYRRANDRQAKFNVSKKLAKEAKHCHTQLSELLHKVKEASTAVETVTVVETVVAVTAPNGKALAEYEQLTAQNAELRAEISRLRRDLEELRDSYPDRESLIPLAIDSLDPHAQGLYESMEHTRQTRELDARQETIDALNHQVQELSQEVEQTRQEGLHKARELGAHQETIDVLNRQVQELGQEIEKTRQEGQQKTQELDACQETIDAMDYQLQELSQEMDQIRQEDLHKATELGVRQETIDALNRQVQELGHEMEQTRHEGQQKTRELREKLKKYALNLKKRGQENTELEQKVQELTTQLQELQVQHREEFQELQAKHNEEQQQQQAREEPLVDTQQVEQLQQQVAKLSEELKAKIHANMETRESLRHFKQQLDEQELLFERREAEYHATSLENEELRRARIVIEQKALENEKESLQREQENIELRQEVDKLTATHANLQQKLAEQALVLVDLRRQLDSKSLKFDKSKELIKHRNATIQSLQRELQQLRQDQSEQSTAEAEPFASGALMHAESQLAAAEREKQHLHAQLTAAQEEHSLLAQQYARDKVDFEVTIARLNTLHEGIQAKLQEDASCIESLEAQNLELQAKSARLNTLHENSEAKLLEDASYIKSLEGQISELQAKSAALEQDLQAQLTAAQEEHSLLAKSAAFEKHWQTQLTAAQDEHSLLAQKYASDKADFEVTIAKLNTLHEGSQAKLQEDASYIESLERQNSELQTKSSQLITLNEGIESLEAENSELRAKSAALEEHWQAQLTAAQEEHLLLTQRYASDKADFEATIARLNTLHEDSQAKLQKDVYCIASLEEQNSELQAKSAALEEHWQAQLTAAQDEHSLLAQKYASDKADFEATIARLNTLHEGSQAKLQEDASCIESLEAQNWDLKAQNWELETKSAAPEQHLQAQLTAAQEEHSLLAQKYASDKADFEATIARLNTLHEGIQVKQQKVASCIESLETQNWELETKNARLNTLHEGSQTKLQEDAACIASLEAQNSELRVKSAALEEQAASQVNHQAQVESRTLILEQRLLELERLLGERDLQLAKYEAANEERVRFLALEGLIQPAAAALPPAVAPSLDMFFGVAPEETVTDAVSHQLDLGLPQTEPVEEPLIQPKKAYLCQPQQQQEQAHIDWGVDEDPWASAATEAPQTDVEPLHARIAHLEQHLAAAEQQKAELQTKTAKLMKRLKEYKTKATPAVTPAPLDNDLDSAIIEELKHQLQLHETRQAQAEEQLKQQQQQLQQQQQQLQQQQQQLQQQQQQQIPDLAAVNQQWEQIVEQKCSEVASIWQEHLVQREAAFKAQLEEISQQQQQQPEQSQSSVEAAESQQDVKAHSNDMLLKMQKALETQEMEIVTLKEQLAIRSAEYARLAAQYDPFQLQNRDGGGNSAPTTASGPPSLSGSHEPPPEYVLRADLDYALMMLHQRDMRVEEMILELVQLLDERDHLQLKLSDTLRQLEVERSRVSVSDEPSSSAASGSPGKTSSAGSSSGEQQQQQPLGVVAAAGSSDLEQKLAELQTVKHSKDKAIVDEREQRLQQMMQLQKDMAKQAAGAGPGPGAASQQVPLQPPALSADSYEWKRP